jgi:hypothetical protein
LVAAKNAAAIVDELALSVNGGQPMPRRERHELVAPRVVEPVAGDQHRGRSLLDERLEGQIEALLAVGADDNDLPSRNPGGLPSISRGGFGKRIVWIDKQPRSATNGTSSRMISNCLPTSSLVRKVTPEALPPGSASISRYC